VEDRFGAAGGHIYQMIVNHDYAANNVGLLLFSDIAINSVGLILVIWHAIACKRETGTTDSKVISGQRTSSAIRSRPSSRSSGAPAAGRSSPSRSPTPDADRPACAPHLPPEGVFRRWSAGTWM